MTAVVSLLFIAMIPIDCKITFFPLYLFVNFFLVTIKINQSINQFFLVIDQFISATSKERMITKIIFAGATFIK